MKGLDTVAMLLLVVGGLNWGLIGLADINLVSWILGMTMFAKLVYILVGLSAVYLGWKWVKKAN